MMKTINRALCLLAVGTMSLCGSVASAKTQNFDTQVRGLAREWHGPAKTPLSQRISTPAMLKNGAQRHIVSDFDRALNGGDTFGTLYLPNGEEWTYVAQYNYADNSVDQVTFTIYNDKLEKVTDLTVDLELGEGETSINSVAINPNVTRKFFNYNDAYEVMVYVHATTEDYSGHVYTKVYSLGSPDEVCTVEGDAVLMVNMAQNSWEENFYVIFFSEEFGVDPTGDPESPSSYTYIQNFSIYKKAGWGTDGPELLHNFAIDYNTISGSGENMLPIIPVKHGAKMYYVLPHYLKPYFDQSIPVWDEPVINPDNAFVIDLYNDDFEIIKTTTIPMEVTEGYLYTFPEMGGLLGADDASFGIYTTGDEPAYVVTYENYDPTKEDYVSSYYVYDTDGQVIGIIAEDMFDCLYLGDIPGEEPQICFLDGNQESFVMVDVYSCQHVARIPIVYDGYNLSTSLDRVTANGSYQYAIAMSNGEIAPDGKTVMHRVAYFNNDGSFSHWEDIMMGENVVMAQPYINGTALNPYLFNTDRKREYMVLVKEPKDLTTTATVERLYVINTDGEKLLVHEPNEYGKLSSIWLQNLNTNSPLLVSAYSNDDWQYTLCYNNLPLTTQLEGEGTIDNPYLIATAGDMLLIDKAPAAYYSVTDDLDFSGMVWTGGDAAFSGVFDGQGHAMFNLVIEGPGLFPSLQGGAEVRDFDIVSPILVPVDEECGFITASTVYQGTTSPVISGINIFAPTVNSDDFDGEFGCIAGYTSTFTAINDCAVFEADIYLPRASVGGMVGRQISGSTASRCYFGGSIVAHQVGGIVGSAETSAACAADCHVNADIQGVRYVGGIAGVMDQERGYRPKVERCYVEGSLKATAANDPSIGGIAGALSMQIYDDEVVSIHDCVINADINYNTDAALATAHRIVGHTVDVDKVIDWDNIQPGMSEDEYPYLDLHETLLANNYAVKPIIDNNYADDAASVEGKTVDSSELTQEFYTSLGYAFGDDATAPWQVGEDGIVLYLEDAKAPESPFDGIADAVVNAQLISVVGNVVYAEGNISVYDTAGRKVIGAQGVADLSRLGKGVYIISARTATGNAVVKYSVK